MPRYRAIAILAREIASKIGNPIINDGYYNDTQIGYEYKFEELMITYYFSNSSIYICLNEQTVLNYSIDNDKLEDYLDSNWGHLIVTIYDQIPTIQANKEKEKNEFNYKINQLKALEEAFKLCIKYDSNDQTFLSRLNEKLELYGINVIKNKYYPLEYNYTRGEYEESAIQTTTFYIKYSNETVAEFNGDTFNVFPCIEYLANSFVPGAWINNFKKSLNQTIQYENQFLKNRTDNKAIELYKKFINQSN